MLYDESFIMFWPMRSHIIQTHIAILALRVVGKSKVREIAVFMLSMHEARDVCLSFAVPSDPHTVFGHHHRCLFTKIRSDL